MNSSIHHKDRVNLSPDSELQSSLRQLSINDKGPSKDTTRANDGNLNLKNAKKPKEPIVADSWEDEADSASEPDQHDIPTTTTSTEEKKLGKQEQHKQEEKEEEEEEEEEPFDPPPTRKPSQTASDTPIPTYGNPSPSTAASSRSPRDPSRRPEKQTAVAGRMIAGALGMRAPKRTEEQRAYDRAVKEQEVKRKDREKEEAAKACEDEERAKTAVWDD